MEHLCALRVVADATAAAGYDDVDWTGPAALIVGSEAHGATNLGRRLGTTTARIPLAANVESLNVAAAAAICLFEQRRQRGATAEPTRAPAG